MDPFHFSNAKGPWLCKAEGGRESPLALHLLEEVHTCLGHADGGARSYVGMVGAQR